MRRFQFPLQTVLRLRGQFERQSRRVLAAAMAEVGGVEGRLRSVGQGLRECADQANGVTTGAQLARALETGLRHYQWRLQRELGRVQAVAESARVAFLERRQELRSLERLRERGLDEWRTAAVAAEQGELDELARMARAGQEAQP